MFILMASSHRFLAQCRHAVLTVRLFVLSSLRVVSCFCRPLAKLSPGMFRVFGQDCCARTLAIPITHMSKSGRARSSKRPPAQHPHDPQQNTTAYTCWRALPRRRPTPARFRPPPGGHQPSSSSPKRQEQNRNPGKAKRRQTKI